MENPTSNGRWILAATILASSMAFIDGTALNIVLSDIQDGLNASGAEMLWIINGYLLFLASLILVGGSLGDHFGRKRVFAIGIGLFTLASFLCGIAPNTLLMIVARMLQGMGGALMVPGSLAIISASFPVDQRGKAIGTWSAFSSVTTLLGPIIGGIMADLEFWRGIFFINLPLAAVALWIVFNKVPESRDEQAKQLDFLGAFLVTIGLAGLSYGFIEAPEQGFDAPLIIGTLAVGVIALVLFVVVEARSPHPMIPLSLFQSRTFSGTNLMTLFLYGALSVATLFMPLNFAQVQGYERIEISLALLPFALLLTFMSRWAGGLVDRYGPRLPLTVGPTIVGVGFFALTLPALTDGFSDYWTNFLPAILIMGLGMGITVAPLTTAVMGSVSSRQAGTASGVNNAVARTGSVLAIALLGAVALFSFRSNLDDQTQNLDLSTEERAELKKNASDLGNTDAPETVEANTQVEIESAVKDSFISTFRLVLTITAVIAWISAALAWLTVENRMQAVA